MKGSFIDFIEFLSENEDLRKDIIDVAAKHGFEFSDEVSDVDLEAVVGGVIAPSPADSKTNTVRGGREETETPFQNFDQKYNQLFSLLSTVMKTSDGMRQAIQRNIL